MKPESKRKTETPPMHTAAERAAIEQRHRRHIKVYAAVFMLGVVALTEFGLGSAVAYFSSDVMHTALFSVLSYVYAYLEPTVLFFCFGILGYSVLRYGLRRSVTVLIFAFCAVILVQLGAISALCVRYSVSLALGQLLSENAAIYAMNLGSVLLEVAVLAGFCAFYRATHSNKTVMRVGITRDNFLHLKNPLTRVYLFMSMFTALFSLIPAILQAVTDYIDLGFFQNFSEFFTFVKPFLVIVLFFFVGFFIMELAGAWLTADGRRLRRTA